MITVVFIATTAICAVGWLTCYIACAGLVHYNRKNGYKLPDKQEARECTRSAAKKFFKL